MKILHTSDWHLGANLDRFSRLYEQELFIDEINRIADEENIGLIIIAGDVFDTFNPPSSAERLFYRSLKLLSGNGKRPVIIVAGNHDNPARLTAPSPLARELGIIIFGTPMAEIESGFYGEFYVKTLMGGCVELTVNGEKVIVAAMPYASERRLNEVIENGTGTVYDEKTFQSSFSERIGVLFAQMDCCFKTDAINIAVGHFHIAGGGTSSGSERDIQLGGSFAVLPNALPKGAQYIAMGHLHRPQKIKTSGGYAYYSGSPIQYGLGEAGYSKCVFIAEVTPGKTAAADKRFLSCTRPIEKWEFGSLEDAAAKCETYIKGSCWVYIVINGPVNMNGITRLKSLNPDIVNIESVIPESGDKPQDSSQFIERDIIEEFADFYESQKNTKPSAELLELFNELLQSED